MIKCPYEDDEGKICGKPLTEREEEEDGMCDPCACALWDKVKNEINKI